MKSQHGSSSFSLRQLRVGEELKRLLALIFLRTSFRNPDLRDVEISVTEVRLTADLKIAYIYVRNMTSTPIRDLMPALERVSPWFRRKVARKMRLRYVPKLVFRVDESLDQAARIEELLNSPNVKRDLD